MRRVSVPIHSLSLIGNVSFSSDKTTSITWEFIGRKCCAESVGFARDSRVHRITISLSDAWNSSSQGKSDTFRKSCITGALWQAASPRFPMLNRTQSTPPVARSPIIFDGDIKQGAWCGVRIQCLSQRSGDGGAVLSAYPEAK